MTTSDSLGASVPDLSTCDHEPIHLSGSIQPFGILVTLDPRTLRILQASANATRLLDDPSTPVPGQDIRAVLRGAPESFLSELRETVTGTSHYFRSLKLLSDGEARGFHAIAHLSDGAIILELEEQASQGTGSFEDVYPLVRTFVEDLYGVRSVAELCALAVREVRLIAGFDRVLIYRFDEGWNGTVVAEDRNDALPSYLDLRFPASDIPAQARELYRLNPMRIIPSSDYSPIPIEPAINPLTSRPIDLSLSVLRSVSPVHLEYMRNMGTGASMSMSLLCDGRLWGLISCHNKEPKQVPFHLRTACDHLARILGLQLAAKEHAAEADQRIQLRLIQGRLLGHMAEEEHFLDGLTKHVDDLLGLTHADGAAIIFDNTCTLIGSTPPEATVHRIVDWLTARGERSVYATHALAAEMEEAAGVSATASGLLAIGISQIHPDYVLWFRPEVVRTVKWGGDPRKPMLPPIPGARIHPRKSFETWQETVRNTALPWSAAEVAAAEELRTATVGIVLRKAEELAALSNELKRSNKELEAFSYSVSHDLRAPFRHIVGFAELLREREGERLSERGHHYVDSIIESAHSAGTLVDNLLSFSQMGRATMNMRFVDMNHVVEDARRRIEPDTADRRIVWKIGDLGAVEGDPAMLRLVMQNLLSNAIKFTRLREKAVIEMGRGAEQDGFATFYVKDNGVGFDMTYVNKLFGVFQRLHRSEEFEGTGIGLANVRRIVERHGGSTWAQGAEGAGATFFITLPSAPMRK